MVFDPTNSYIGELTGYPSEYAGIHGASRAIRKVRVNWADRYNWAALFAYNPDKQGYPYTRIAGIPTNTAITGIGIEPDKNSQQTMGSYSDEAVYTYAILNLEYRPVATLGGGIVLIEELQPVFDAVPLPTAKRKWLSDGSAVDKGLSLSRQIAGYNFMVRYTRLPYIINTGPIMNCVNYDAFVPRLFPTLFFPRGTMLYVSGDLKGEMSYDGATRYQQTHHVRIRAADWNMEWNPNLGNWDWLTDALGNKIFQYGYAIFNGSV